MLKKIIYIILIFSVIGGCKKVDIQEPISGIPVFSTNTIIGNSNLNWQAGVEDYFMFTEFTKNDSSNLYTMIGRLAKDDNCTIDCEASLSFSFRGNAATPSISDFDIGAALQNGSREYFQINPSIDINTGYRYNFQAELIDQIDSTNFPVSFIWEINGNVDSLSGENLEFDYFENSDFDVRLEMETSSSCTSFIERTIPAGFGNGCELQIDISSDSAGIVFVGSLNGATGNTSISLNNIPYQDSTPIALTQILGNQITINANDSGGCLYNMEICIQGGNTPAMPITSVAVPRITYQVDTVFTTTMSEQFSTVIIEYNNGNEIFSTANGGNNNSTFTITNIEDFDDNEAGEKTKKLTIQYNAILYNSVGESQSISGESVIAVAYPFQ